MSINEYKRAGAVKDYQNYMKMAAGGFMDGSMSQIAGPGKKRKKKKKKKCKGGNCPGGGRKWRKNRF
jgi:hypothetical protein